MRASSITVSDQDLNPFDVLNGEFSDIDLLHAISVELIGEQDRTALYGKIVDAAVAISKSQFGTMQLLRHADDHSGNALELLYSRGLPPHAQAFWQLVKPSAHSSCTKALKTGRRAIIPDFEAWDEIAGTEDLMAFRQVGIRSAQTTPLLARDGTLLGMISTHWNEPHDPSARDLRMLDILARQAADLLERTIAEELLRAREQKLEIANASLLEKEELQQLLTGELEHRVKNLFSMVNAIASHTLRGSTDQLRVQTLQQRLNALSSAHDLLLKSSWQAALLKDVAVAAVNSAGVSGRVRIDGPAVEVGSKAGLNVALLVHELATNALKHGSLSVGSGQVDLTWHTDSSDNKELLRLTWRETKGPQVVEPSGTGFGSRLISAGLNGSGTVDMKYHPSGLVCEIAASVADLKGAE